MRSNSQLVYVMQSRIDANGISMNVCCASATECVRQSRVMREASTQATRVATSAPVAVLAFAIGGKQAVGSQWPTNASLGEFHIAGWPKTASWMVAPRRRGTRGPAPLVEK